MVGLLQYLEASHLSEESDEEENGDMRIGIEETLRG